ncbi:hypothetical protein VTN49DRAFT_5554 [Thermomyces lanuginosus]|uniref:uncharacterized protein n=1 Tax=Thermomyces lanuginosus TaxID=5541 RepID=UPI003742B462
MPAASLLAMSTRAAAQNVKNLVDIGNMPYSLVRPILSKVESPAQLRAIELQSPHIMEEDRELWIEFIKRDIPQWERFELPEKSNCWYDIYRDLLEQVQREVEEDAIQLKLAVDEINSKRANSGSKFLGENPQAGKRLPKLRPTATQRYAAHDRKMGGIKATYSAVYTEDGEKIWTLDKTPSVRPGRARSESSKRSSLFTSKTNKALTVPTHRLKPEVSQIKQVPRWLVDQHKQPPPASTTVARKPAGSTQKPSTTVTSTTQSPEPRKMSIRAPATSPLRQSEPVTRTGSSLPQKRPADEVSSSDPETKRAKVAVSSNPKASSPPLASPPPKASSPPIAPALRRRPAPSIFIQPKKKKP